MAEKIVEGLEELANMEYPGRVIMLGKDREGNNVVVYGLSGRSPSSQARRLVKNDENQSVSIKVTDPEQLKKGDPALLVYTAIQAERVIGALLHDVIIVSNGSQTEWIPSAVGSFYKGYQTDRIPTAWNVLPLAFARQLPIKSKDGREIDLASYEPDSISTPRISGVVVRNGDYAGLCIIKKGMDGKPLKCYYDVPLIAGQGNMIATYDGPNPPGKEPVPSFRGEPRPVKMGMSHGVDHFVESVYQAMGQYVVSVACMVDKGEHRNKITIKNKF